MARRRSSRNRNIVQEKKVIRCKEKMVPVFENDSCSKFEYIGKKETDRVCKNCKYSF